MQPPGPYPPYQGPPRPGMPPPGFPPSMAYPMPPGMPPRPMAPVGYPGPPMLPRPAAPVIVAGPALKKTILYVGKIASTLPETAMASLLEACGPVKSWKPMRDPETGKTKGFGFVEYEDADGVLKALRLLNGLSVDGQELLLKTDSATQRYIDEYVREKERRRAEAAAAPPAQVEGGEEGEAPPSPSPKAAEDNDEAALERIMAIVSQRAAERAAEASVADRANDFLSSIGSGSAPVAAAALPGPPPGPAPAAGALPGPPPPGAAGGGAEREAAVREGGGREREVEKERERRKREERDLEDRAYREKLREWERFERERAKAADAERDAAKRAAKERARACKADNEEAAPDDDEPAWRRKPYRESRRALERRRRREREEEEDEADREREERDRKRAREAASRAVERAATPLVEAPAASPLHAPNGLAAAEAQLPVPTATTTPNVEPDDPIYQAMMAAAAAPPRQPSPAPAPAPEPTLAPAPERMPAPAQPPPAKRKKAALFGGDDEEEEDKPKRRLIPIQYSEEELRAAQAPASASGSDPKATIKHIIDSIPTTRDGVFAYAINWDAYERAADKIKATAQAWVNKKIVELLGEPEESLASFIMDKLGSRTTAGALHEELKDVLDSDADGFVLRLFRMLIFETEKFAQLGA